ncbi:MAG: GMP synthase (glutamine-hydrolyzing) [Clostridia bacterium]
MRDMILVLDFDGVNSAAVARKLRAERIYCKIIPVDTTLETVREQDPSGLILVGGTGEGITDGAPTFDARLLTMGLPLLALGSAARLLCLAMGGALQGVMLDQSIATVTYADLPIFKGIAPGERWFARAERLQLPEALTSVAEADGCTVAFTGVDQPLFGLQFHIERNDPDGMAMLSNFALTICECTTWWSAEAYVERAVSELKRVVGDGAALCAMSGGIDSSVCALLAHQALGKQAQCIFVDTGLMRKDEGDQIEWFYRGQLGLELTRVNARDRFLRRLTGIKDAAQKREIVQDEFRNVLLEEAAKNPQADVLVQGTNYSDILSSMNLNEQTLRQAAQFRTVIEPVRELFKDEVRRVGELLGLPAAIIHRQSFPGAGLAVRIVGEVNPGKLELLRAADAILREEIAASGQEKRLAQYFAVLGELPDAELGNMIVLRAVHLGESGALAARLPYDLLERVVERIHQEIPGVRRILYDLTPSESLVKSEWQ